MLDQKQAPMDMFGQDEMNGGVEAEEPIQPPGQPGMRNRG